MKILVPYDGSRQSLSTLQLVASMALNEGSQITILHVVRTGILSPSDMRDPIEQQELLVSKSKHLNELAQELTLWQPQCIIDFKIRFGHVAETILRTSDEDNYDLIVVGSHGQSRLKSIVFGSVSRNVLINSRRPVLIVKPTQSVAQGQMGSGGYKVLVPIENTISSFHTIDWLANQAWKAGTRFKLLNVVPEFKELRANAVSDQLEILYAKWARVKENIFSSMEAHALTLGRNVGMGNIEMEVCPGEPKQEILRVADEWMPDIIAMGSQSRPGLNRILSKSVSAHVGRHCQCAELIVYHNHMYSMPELKPEAAESTSYIEIDSGKTTFDQGPRTMTMM